MTQLPDPDPDPDPDPGLRSPSGVLRRHEIDQLGISDGEIRSRVRRHEIDSPYRGVYTVPSAEVLRTQRLRAAHVHLGPESVAVLASALDLHGIQGATGERPPQFAMPPGLEKHQRANLELHFWTIPTEQKVYVDGLPVTSVARTLADAARLLPRMQAVAAVDSAFELGLTSPQHLPAIADLMKRRPHCVSGRLRLAEARLHVQSPLETRVRIRATDGGLPPDALQVPIYDAAGQLLGYGDMGYQLPNGSWLIVEADGVGIHARPEALLHDRRRQNAFLVSSTHVLRFTWADTQTPQYIPGVIRPMLERNGWRRGAV